MTRALSWGWWSHQASSLVKLIIGSSTLVSLGRQLVIWTLCTIHMYVFLTFLEEPAIVFPPTITLISQNGALGCSSARRLGSKSLGGFSKAFSLPTNHCSFLCLMKLLSVASSCSTQQCRARGPYGNDNTCYSVSCKDHPLACLVMLVLGHPLSAWGLGQDCVQWGEVGNPARWRPRPFFIPSVIRLGWLSSSI